MNNKFKITEKMLSDTAVISELVGKLSVTGKHSTPMLRRTNRLRTIHGTLAIEQNTLSLEQVTTVIEGKHVLAPPRDIAEVRNAFAAYEMIDELDPYSVDSLLEAHGTMMRGLIDDAGMFRSGAVVVADDQGKVVHIGTLPRYVPESVMRLLDRIRESELPMVIKSCIFHFEFEMIHPFSDGNGRMGRLWHTLLLSHWDKLFMWLPVESVIRDRQSEYYRALNRSDSDGNACAFTEFMLNAIKQTLIDASGTEKFGRKKSEINESTRRKLVLDHLSVHPFIMNADVCDGLAVSTATANRILNKLCDDGTIERIRAGKHWAYVIRKQNK